MRWQSSSASRSAPGLDLVTHGDYHCDEDLAGRSWHHYPLQRWKGFAGDYLQPDETTAPWLHYPPGTLLNEIYTGWRWPHVVDASSTDPLDYPKLWRMAQARASQPVRFGTCCSQVMALFLDIHTPKYTDKRQVIWDMAEAMNTELLALRDAGCRLIQIEEPTLHFMANTFGKDHESVKFMIDAFNREVEGLDDCEIWIHTCWGNPNMQRVMEDTSYAASIELYLERCKGDVWTLEMKDRNRRDLELFEPLKHDLKKKICIGAVSHRTLQADRAGRRRRRDPPGAAVHSARAPHRVERLRLRPAGLQSRHRVLQGHGHRAGHQHRASRSCGFRRRPCRPPTRRCRPTVCRKHPVDELEGAEWREFRNTGARATHQAQPPQFLRCASDAARGRRRRASGLRAPESVRSRGSPAGDAHH